jgi:ABC-type lipoprotein release transport system permease subunit
VIFLWKHFFFQSQIRQQVFWVSFSLGLSLSFILANIGLMEGYEKIFKAGLKQTSQDISLFSRNEFITTKNLEHLNLQNVGKLTSIIQWESFAVAGDKQRGVLVRSDSTHILKRGEVEVGRALASELDLEVGSTVALVVSGQEGATLPKLIPFVVRNIKAHPLYQQNLRFVSVSEAEAATLLQINSGYYNLFLLDTGKSDDEIDSLVLSYKKMLPEFSVKSYWSDYASLLEAVQVEKVAISVVLQLVILVSMFNVVSFFHNIVARNQRDIFLFRSMGVSKKKVLLFLWSFSLCMVFFAMLIAFFLVEFYNFALSHFDILKLPSKIYQLGVLQLNLSTQNYCLIFSLALIWVLLSFAYAANRLLNNKIVPALKGEMR